MSTNIRKYLLHFVSGILIAASALFIYSPSALAGGHHGYYGYDGYKFWNVNIRDMCVTSPENRCFLVVDFDHNAPFPFFQRMDQGFWYKGHYYTYYHRYYTYQYYNGNNSGVFSNNPGFCYHTRYYYTY